MDPCVNPESAQCANPQDYAQGNGRWGITGPDDPCAIPDGKGGGTISNDPALNSISACAAKGVTWIPPGWGALFNPDGSVTRIQPAVVTPMPLCIDGAICQMVNGVFFLMGWSDCVASQLGGNAAWGASWGAAWGGAWGGLLGAARGAAGGAIGATIRTAYGCMVSP